MKITAKKRIFALVMCAMLVISSISVFAANYAEIGVGDEKATCSVSCYTAYGIAKTTPFNSGISCSTTIQLFDSTGLPNNNGSGSTSISVRTYGAKALGRAESTHRAGTFYTSLVDYV